MPAVLRLPGTKISGVPIPPIDEMFPAQGALIYVNPAHPVSPWNNGVPSSVPNLAAAQAASVIGSSNVGITLTNTIGAGEGIVERSSKKALHVINSKTKDVTGHALQLLMTPEMQAWILANKSHFFYIGASLRITRAGGAQASQHIARLGQTSSTFAVAVQEAPTGNSIYGLPSPNNTSATTPGLARVSAAGQGSSIASLVQWFFTAGPLAAAYLHAAPSVELFSLYIEDLTISGRGFAGAEAAHQEHHTKMHAKGGIYFGDTVTDPATVA